MPVDPGAAIQDFEQSCIRCGICAQTDCGNFAPGTPCLGDICASLFSGEDTWKHFPFTCALCNRCTISCPVSLHASDACKPLRGMLLCNQPDTQKLYRKFRTDFKYNLFSTLRARNKSAIEDIRYISGQAGVGKLADQTAFFPGCSIYAYAPELDEKISAWLREEGLAAYTLHFCCGATFYDSGFFEEYDVYRERAVAFLQEHGIRRLIVTCPHCMHLLPELIEGTDIEILRLPDLLMERGMLSESDETISFHDACYDRDEGVIGQEARALFPKASIVSMQHEGKDTLCCGGGGMVSVYACDYCTYRRNKRLAEIDDVKADRILSTCFSCVNSLQRGIGTTPVQHYLEQIFGVTVDWNAVYGGVDALEADPAYECLCESDEKTFD